MKLHAVPHLYKRRCLNAMNQASGECDWIINTVRKEIKRTSDDVVREINKRLNVAEVAYVGEA